MTKPQKIEGVTDTMEFEKVVRQAVIDIKNLEFNYPYFLPKNKNRWIKESYKIIKTIMKNHTKEISQTRASERQRCVDSLPKKVKVELEEPVLRQYNSTPNAYGGYSSVPFYCSLCGMGEIDIQDNKIDGAYHCVCSVWTSPCGGKWVQWFDKEKAQKMVEELPSEDNIFNSAIDQAKHNLEQMK